jgi:hypothetical protein
VRPCSAITKTRTCPCATLFWVSRQRRCFSCQFCHTSTTTTSLPPQTKTQARSLPDQNGYKRVYFRRTAQAQLPLHVEVSTKNPLAPTKGINVYISGRVLKPILPLYVEADANPVRRPDPLHCAASRLVPLVLVPTCHDKCTAHSHKKKCIEEL